MIPRVRWNSENERDLNPGFVFLYSLNYRLTQWAFEHWLTIFIIRMSWSINRLVWVFMNRRTQEKCWKIVSDDLLKRQVSKYLLIWRLQTGELRISKPVKRKNGGRYHFTLDLPECWLSKTLDGRQGFIFKIHIKIWPNSSNLDKIQFFKKWKPLGVRFLGSSSSWG